MKNLTYSQLIELAPKDRPFQIEVNTWHSNQYILWVCITDNDLWTLYGEYDEGFWKTEYVGTFTLIDEYRNMYEKPEVLKVGQKVRIMESVKGVEKCSAWDNVPSYYVEKTGVINGVWDYPEGVSYSVMFDKNPYCVEIFPHYCVMPVEEEEKERTLEDILSELSDTDKEIIRNKFK
jgi:hypothetical protein